MIERRILLEFITRSTNSSWNCYHFLPFFFKIDFAKTSNCNFESFAKNYYVQFVSLTIIIAECYHLPSARTRILIGIAERRDFPERVKNVCTKVIDVGVMSSRLRKLQVRREGRTPFDITLWKIVWILMMMMMMIKIKIIMRIITTTTTMMVVIIKIKIIRKRRGKRRRRIKRDIKIIKQRKKEQKVFG